MHLTVARRTAVALLAAAMAPFAPPQRGALAVQGAAEMDAEFYVRGLLGVPPSPPASPQVLAQARKMDMAFVTGAIDAVESTLAPSLSTTPAALRDAAAARRKALSQEYDRVLSSGAFGDGRGYDAAAALYTATSDPESQFAFDLSLLCLFTQLADARLPRTDASECSRRLGTKLLTVLPPPSGVTTSPSVGELVKGMRALLGQLQSAGYLASWAIDDSDADESLWAARSSLSLTRLTVSLNDSASLRAALLLNGRDGASPELAKPLLIAYLRSRGVEVSEVSEYFLDSVYRPSPLDYKPNQQILTLSISPAAPAA